MRSWLRVQVGDKVKQKDGDQHLFPLGFKFAVLGVSGGIDQPLSLLMEMNPLVLVLHLYGVVNSSGVTDHISCMSTGAVVRGFLDHPQLENALVGMDFVIIPAGTIGNLGMTRDSVQHQC